MCYFNIEGGKMNKKKVMCDFINEINNRKLMTLFIKNIFKYEEFYDYNYIFRMTSTDYEIIIDIYDNVSNNRFNRYIFSFIDLGYDIKIIEENNVFVNYISINNVIDCDNNSHKEEHNITGQYDYFVSHMYEAHKMFNYKLPVNGNDVMDVLNISGGLLVKKVLDALLNRAFPNPDTLTRESCLKQIPKIATEILKKEKKLFVEK